MYGDEYFPDFLVDKVKKVLTELDAFLADKNYTPETVQEAFDKATLQINGLEEEFEENGSEIETAARDSIAETVDHMLQHYDIDIDLEEALREREW
ncbi:DUF5713 family protein [Bombiscardovia apis]|nr:DUF5713 family protein [Bombiscardovia apis]